MPRRETSPAPAAVPLPRCATGHLAARRGPSKLFKTIPSSTRADARAPSTTPDARLAAGRDQ